MPIELAISLTLLGAFGIVAPALCVWSIMLWEIRNVPTGWLEQTTDHPVTKALMDNVFWTITGHRYYKIGFIGSLFVGAVGLQSWLALLNPI